MNYTTQTSRPLPTVTPVAYALIRAWDGYASLLRATAPVFGHDNREIIGRVQANLPLDSVPRTR